MNNSNHVLVVTEDLVLFEQIRADNPLEIGVEHLQLSKKALVAQTDADFIRSSEHGAQTAIIILDLGDVERERQHDLIRDIKLAQPSVSLIVMGEADDITHALDTQIQPLIYRAFKKPISVKQLALSLDPALSFYTMSKQSETPLAAQQPLSDSGSSSKSSIVLLGFGLAAVCVGIWYFVFNTQEPTISGADNSLDNGVVQTDTGSIGLGDELDTENADAVNSNRSDIDLTIDLGELALADGRLIAPAKDNAAHYFGEALKQDRFNTRAYAGSKALSKALLDAYPQLIRSGKYVEAYAHLDTFQKLAPLDRSLDSHLNRARSLVSSHYQSVRDSDNEREFAAATQQYERVQSRLSDDGALDSILKNEKETKERIQTALSDGRLIPPSNSNAYSLLTKAVSDKSIRRTDYQNFLEELENKMLGRIDVLSKATELTNQQAADAKALVQYGGLLDINSASISKLQAVLDANTASKPATNDSTDVAKVEKPAIAPAKLVKRALARYPNRALERGIEGWVAVSFQIDQEGRTSNVVVTNSQPKNTFDAAAVKAVEDWEFLPAMDIASGRPVVSEPRFTKIHFKVQ